MKKFIMAVFLVFMLFGCADDENTTRNNNILNPDEYFEVAIDTLTNIPVSDNVSQWGFEPYDETQNLHVFLADKLGRPNKNTNNIKYISGTVYPQYFYFDIYENNATDASKLHEMVFYLPYSNTSGIEHAIIDYYIKFIKTEPYKTIYKETIYIKKN